MSFQDQTLPCQGCGQPFVFTAGEQEFYEKKGFKETPKRCRACRDARKTGGPSSGQAAQPPQRREPAPPTRARQEPRRAPEVEALGARPRPRLGDGARIAGGEEALRRAVGGGADLPAPAAASVEVQGTAPLAGPAAPARRDDDDLGNRASSFARRLGRPAVEREDQDDDDIGNRIDVEPGAGMSRGIREAIEPYARAASGGPLDLPCVACGTSVRVVSRPPPGRSVFCSGCA